MRIIELSMLEFDNFASTHPLRNYCQHSKFARLMGEKGYSYEYIGYQDDSNNLVAASLIANKKIDGGAKFAYAPKGFLIDYYNTELLKLFVKDLFVYYKKKGMAFIKINPEIIIGEISADRNYSPMYNQNVKIIDVLKEIGFKRRREIVPLDFIYPRISPYINLKTFDVNNLSDSCLEKINAASKNGLSIEEATNKDVNIFYEFVKDDIKENASFFRNLLNIYQNGDAELLLVKADYEDCLINARDRYEKELDMNNYWNELIQTDNSEENLNSKMQSDKNLIAYKNELVAATDNLKKNKYKYVGGAVIIKYKNRISIIANGVDKNEANLNVNYYLFKALIDRYRNDFDFLDLNGVASNFNQASKYWKFNEEKLDFKPTLYEFIGEFDLVINDNAFKRIQSKGLLSKEFIPSHSFKDEEI